MSAYRADNIGNGMMTVSKNGVTVDDGYVITHWMNLPKPPKEDDND